MGCVRYSEDGHDPVRSCDLDLGDERFDQCFALGFGAGADYVVDVLGDLQERGCWRRGRRPGDLHAQFVLVCVQLRCPCFELGEPRGEVFGVEGAVLERGEVPVGRGAGPGQLVLGRGQLGAPVVCAGGVAGSGLSDGAGDEVVLVPVEAGQRGDDGLLDGVGVHAAGSAPRGVVADAGEAGVVPVDAAPAVCPGADHRFAARRAAHQPGEQVIRSVRGPFGVVLAAGG
jgi:hypothetical protein